MEFTALISLLIVVIERTTEVVKKILEQFKVELSPTAKVIASMIIGGGVGYVVLSTPILTMFGYEFQPYPIPAGIIYGIVASLPSNIVHDLMKWVQDIEEILKEKAKNQNP